MQCGWLCWAIPQLLAAAVVAAVVATEARLALSVDNRAFVFVAAAAAVLCIHILAPPSCQRLRLLGSPHF